MVLYLEDFLNKTEEYHFKFFAWELAEIEMSLDLGFLVTRGTWFTHSDEMNFDYKVIKIPETIFLFPYTFTYFNEDDFLPTSPEDVRGFLDSTKKYVLLTIEVVMEIPFDVEISRNNVLKVVQDYYYRVMKFYRQHKEEVHEAVKKYYELGYGPVIEEAISAYLMIEKKFKKAIREYKDRLMLFDRVVKK